MKINVSNNGVGLAQIRSSIKVGADLAKFDLFISKYPIIDFNDSQQVGDAASCCCPDIEHSCEGIPFPNITLSS